MPAPSKPPAPYRPSIGDLIAFAFCGWLLFIWGSALWNARAEIPRFVLKIPRFIADQVYELIWLSVTGAALIVPVWFILRTEERLRRRWSHEWTEPVPFSWLVQYRVGAWSLYAGGVVLAFLYGNGMLG
jgi:hypothetical protein